MSDGDLEKLDHYFADVLTVPDPRKLSFFVWYTVTTHFCLRGGELQAKLRKSDLIFSTMDDKEVIHLATDFMTKNHRGGLDGTSFTTTGCISNDLQVSAVKKYLSVLHPKCDRLFQWAKTSPGMHFSVDTACWFMCSPLSHNILSGMMGRLSEAAELSQSYTNHCCV